jgi:hypothetical protein
LGGNDLGVVQDHAVAPPENAGEIADVGVFSRLGGAVDDQQPRIGPIS